MNTHERNLVGSLVALMILLWLGFLWHRSSQFPGSLSGFVVGALASILMLIPLVYMFIKRTKSLKKSITKFIPMATLLKIHIYAGVLGPILALIHSAHRFASPVGIILVLFMMVVVLSGFVGRYVLGLISTKMKEKKRQLNEFQHALNDSKNDLRDGVSDAQYEAFTKRTSNILPSFSLSLLGTRQDKSLLKEKELLKIVDAISDTEYSIMIHNTAKTWFSRWLKFHIFISMTLYCVLFIHIASEVYFGLRWL